MIEFISAVYNEEAEVNDLINHVWPYVDKIHIIDDVSTDETVSILDVIWQHQDEDKFDWHQMPEHTGLCELVRIEALDHCENDSWVLMLDADERFAPGVLEDVAVFCADPPAGVTHMYFSQKEYIDGQLVAEFAKVKLFKKSAAHLPEIIHKEPQFDGESVGYNWVVLHRKTSKKQVNREKEYLVTYQKLFDEGKVTQSDVDWFKNMHHFVREIPHG